MSDNDKKKLLGKKTKFESSKKKDSDEEESEEENEEFPEEVEESNEESSESHSSGNPVKKLFENKDEKGFTKGLFGDLEKPTEKGLFSQLKEESAEKKELFKSNTTEKKEQKIGLFGDLIKNNEKKSQGLFGDLNNNTPFGGSLFGNTSGSLFGNSGSLFGNNNTSNFNFNNINNKEKNSDSESEGNDGDNNIGKSNSPKHEYNPEENIDETKNGIKKIYVKEIENVFVENKKENKYISKGEGFLSIETTINDKPNAILVYRNKIGNILFEGIINKDINKIECYEKKLKHIVHIIILMQNEDNKKYELFNIKIPFIKQEDSNKLENKFNEAIKFLKGDL